jgi:2-polyprenyl-3-methyl-5-hydroxy-6-metoxy-1,4-benzoquinol methylase
VRFHRTYLACERHVQPGARVLSIGAGGAYIEAVLASRRQARVTIFDFPGMLEAQSEYYRAHGFETVGVDLAQYDGSHAAEPFDVVLSSEVVEHIPEAPSRHVARFRPHLRRGGVLVITTPNLGNLRNLVKFALQRPVLEKPEFAFLPPAFENEQYHRRVYMADEMKAALERCDLRRERIEFSKDLPFLPFEAVVPRWRVTQISTARAI